MDKSKSHFQKLNMYIFWYVLFIKKIRIQESINFKNYREYNQKFRIEFLKIVCFIFFYVEKINEKFILFIILTIKNVEFVIE